MATETQEQEWLSSYLKPLIGATITGVIVEGDEATIHAVTTDGQKLELGIGQDEEGIGPVFISGLPLPK